MKSPEASQLSLQPQDLPLLKDSMHSFLVASIVNRESANRPLEKLSYSILLQCIITQVCKRPELTINVSWLAILNMASVIYQASTIANSNIQPADADFLIQLWANNLDPSYIK